MGFFTDDDSVPRYDEQQEFVKAVANATCFAGFGRRCIPSDGVKFKVFYYFEFGGELRTYDK